jgi:hypothetical protein
MSVSGGYVWTSGERQLKVSRSFPVVWRFELFEQGMQLTQASHAK